MDQLSLSFEAEQPERRLLLSELIDELAARFGVEEIEILSPSSEVSDVNTTIATQE